MIGLGARMTDILFYIEYRAREFDAAAAIKHHLAARHGLSTEVLSVGQLRSRQGPKQAVGVVVLPWAKSAESWDLLRSIVNAHPTSAFFDMAWDQLLPPHFSDMRVPNGDFQLRKVFHHAWSPIRTAYLTQHGVARERIFENGNPTYTLYDKRYRGLYQTRAEMAQRHGLDPEKPWILFPENYGWAFLDEAQVLRRFVRGRLTAERALRIHRFHVESLSAALTWFSRIDAPVEFIFRPRPVIASSSYMAAFAKEGLTPGPSVRIIKEGSAREWILASDMVLSSFSTTLLEAAIAGKPAFAIEPVPFVPDIAETDWIGLVDRVSSYAAFRDLIERPDRAPKPLKLEDFVRRTAHPCSDALVGAADIIRTIFEQHRSRPPAPYHIAEPRIASLKRVRRQLRDLIGWKRRSKPFEAVQANWLSEEEIAGRVAQVEALFPRAA